MLPHVPFPMLSERNRLGRIPAWPARVHVAKAAVAGDHIRPALLDRAIMAVPLHLAGADRHHRTPGVVPKGLAGRNIEAQARRQGGNRKHQSHDGFHPNSS